MADQNITVSITGSAPNYSVTLNPAGPYTISEAGSTLTMTLNAATASAGFQMVGIGFSGDSGPSESQLTAAVITTNSNNDTLQIADRDSSQGTFEFIMLYKDSQGTIYGLDPEILNDRT